jgi:hypothetical protein
MVQRDENHLVPGQGCREDGPVPPNCSAITTLTCGWLCVAWCYHAAIWCLFTETQVMHQTQTCFHDMTLAPYTSSWWWISADEVPFSHKSLITLLTLMFDHVSASPAIYNWCWDSMTDEAWSSVHERKQCSTCWPGRKFEWNKEHYTRESSCYLIYWITLVCKASFRNRMSQKSAIYSQNMDLWLFSY